MLRRGRKANALLAAATTLGTFTAMMMGSGAARADYGPATYDWTSGQGDVVCVGSDTVQVIGNFISDGDINGHAGYNTSGNRWKVVSLDATADANVRSAYAVTSSASSPQPLDPTVYLRAGQFPANRANGSGSGYNALLADVTQTVTPGGVTQNYPEHINCVRGSSLPSQANYDAAIGTTSTVGRGWGGLHVVRAAFDNIGIAVAQAATNAPTTLSRTQLAFIYDHSPTPWSAVPGYSGPCGTCNVLALLPQAGSGTRKTFIADLQAAGCVCTALNGVNQSVEENDPTAITGATDTADAIVPFSGDRLTLFNNGYFHNPHTPSTNFTAQPAYPTGTASYPGGATITPGVVILGGASYNDKRGLYYTWRAVDDQAGPWVPNSSTQNWASVLFAPGSFLGSFTANAPIQAAGGVLGYLDCGTGGPSAWASAGCVNTVTN